MAFYLRFSYCRGTLPCTGGTIEDELDECRCVKYSLNKQTILVMKNHVKQWPS